MEMIALVASWLKQSNNITVFTGAGISTPSGIPDFRSEDSGLWQGVDPLQVASIYGFRKNPKAFFDWVRPLALKTVQAEPNTAHLALAQLEAMGKLDAIITQNIDMLHSRAGNQNIYELHGHMREATCIMCFKEYAGEPILNDILENEGFVPHCPDCGGVLKPNVILFGEQLPYDQLMAAKKAARNSDVMLIIGSSLEVAPASEIPMIAKRHGAKLVIINQEATIMDHLADAIILGDAAKILPEVMQCLEEIKEHDG